MRWIVFVWQKHCFKHITLFFFLIEQQSKRLCSEHGGQCSEDTLNQNTLVYVQSTSAKHITGDLGSLKSPLRMGVGGREKWKGRANPGCVSGSADSPQCSWRRQRRCQTWGEDSLVGQGNKLHRVRLVSSVLPWHTLRVSSWATRWRIHLTHLQPS